MLTLLRELKKASYKVSRLDPWSRDDDFDILHMFGGSVGYFDMVH